MTQREQKYIAIGDVHGCLKTMRRLLGKLERFYDRTFIFLGDYIDRGPHSMQVVDELLEFQTQVDCIFLRGNHEQMLLDALQKDKMELWMMNGADTTLTSYGFQKAESKSISIPPEHLAFYKQTKLYYDTPDYFFVHAGLDARKTVARNIEINNTETFLWDRSHLNTYETAWEKKVIFGHTPRPEPLQKENMIGIDTGCVYDRLGYGKLSAVILPEEQFEQQICVDN